MKPRIINVKGKPHLVVISYEEYQELLAQKGEDKGEKKRAHLPAITSTGIEVPGTLAPRISDEEAPVKAWRLHRRMTQTELAARAGVSNTLISLIESNDREGSFETYQALARALDVPVGKLTSKFRF